jgi:isopentenyl diphosphate isomerase/L-lactate dehydrogenase-like FMN-dependent dehydrogenase
MANVISRIQSVADAQYFAERRLPAGLYQYLVGGSANATTQDANIAALDATTFNTHVGVCNTKIDIGTTVLGMPLSMPLLTAPTGNIRMLHSDGEIGVARAASDAGIISCHSTVCGHAIEDIVAASKGPVFFQLYFIGDRALTEYALERARKCGVKALIVTVDTAGHIGREWHVTMRRSMPVTDTLMAKLRFLPQLLTRPGWTWDYILDGMQMDCPMGRSRDGKSMTMYEALGTIFSPDAPVPAWTDLKWIREAFDGPVIVKGIQRADDARRAIDCGASAVVVSNHGGMACDGAPGALRMLPNVVEAVGGQVEVLFDGGIRRGSDVVKALALGARAVLLGHAYLYAHSAAGSAGVRHQLELFRAQIDQTLRYIGCPSVRELNRSFLFDYPKAGVVDAGAAASSSPTMWRRTAASTGQ